jgi:protein-glucosylgalactosylhydroxylysine glucosidase
MDGPISPPPVGGTAGNELQYVKWRRGPEGSRQSTESWHGPAQPILWRASRKKKSRTAALAPYPLAGDICLEGVWMSDTPQSVRIIDQAYDFDRRIDHPTEFQSGRSPSQNHRDVVLQPRSAHGGLPRNCY